MHCFPLREIFSCSSTPFTPLKPHISWHPQNKSWIPKKRPTECHTFRFWLLKKCWSNIIFLLIFYAVDDSILPHILCVYKLSKKSPSLIAKMTLIPNFSISYLFKWKQKYEEKWNAHIKQEEGEEKKNWSYTYYSFAVT